MRSTCTQPFRLAIIVKHFECMSWDTGNIARIYRLCCDCRTTREAHQLNFLYAHLSTHLQCHNYSKKWTVETFSRARRFRTSLLFILRLPEKMVILKNTENSSTLVWRTNIDPDLRNDNYQGSCHGSRPVGICVLGVYCTHGHLKMS